MKNFFILIVFVLGVTFISTSCGVKYPNCETDKHCKKKNPENPDEVCFNKKCVECNQDTDCKNDYICKEHQCEPECTQDAQCDAPKVCKSEKCQYECSEKSDCDKGYTCEEHKCTVELECTADIDCDTPEVCINNECKVKQEEVALHKELCKLQKVNFDFNEYTLTSEARSALEADVECINSRPATIIIEGHCDERGTEEYNMNLGQKRANAVKKFLRKLGVTVSIKAISKGEEEPINDNHDEDAWSENRRSEINFE